MKFSGPFSQNRTAAEIEADNAVVLSVLPLSEGWKITHRNAVLILDNNYIHFDQHPYSRKTKFGELIWLSDHAGRFCLLGEAPTHVTTVKNSRLHSMISASKTRIGH